MLTTPSQPYIFPPPSPNSPFPHLPTTTTSKKVRKQHRHSHKIKHALELLIKLSDQAVTPAEREEGEQHVEREEVSPPHRA